MKNETERHHNSRAGRFLNFPRSHQIGSIDRLAETVNIAALQAHSADIKLALRANLDALEVQIDDFKIVLPTDCHDVVRLKYELDNLITRIRRAAEPFV